MGLMATIGLGFMAGKTTKDVFTPPKPPPSPIETAPKIDPIKDEEEAQQASKRRRDLYAGVGRSSTILTGPGGIEAAPVDAATPKVLLGL